MPDYRVEFHGSLGNLAQWNNAVKNTVNSTADAITVANQKIFSQIGNIKPYKNNEAGLFYQKLRTDIDATNRTFIQSGQVVSRVLSDYEVAYDKVARKASIKPIFSDQYRANFKETIGDMDAFLAAQDRIAGTEEKIAARRKVTATNQMKLLQNIAVLQDKLDSNDPNKPGLKQTLYQQQNLSTEAQLVAKLKGDLANIPQTITGQTRVNNRFGPIGQIPNPQYQKTAAELLQAEGALKALTDQTSASMAKAEADILKVEAAATRLEAKGEAAAAALRSANPAYGDRDAAIIATPPIQRDLAQALTRFPDLQKNLLRQGLGNGVLPSDAAGFQKALADQEAQVTRYTKNMRTGITNIQGSFKDASGVVNTFTADIDKQGKVIGRWGGNLAGGGTYLKQTVRDFQKVVQWTVATTLVFGTLAATVSQLKNINELNTNLTRLSITAQTTAEETNHLFDELGQVAINTATPLNEIVKVADDIALATREAGQSTEEWTQKIVDLTTAVGIYTNLTGVDTVEATDQLSAAFKQLNIAPNELVGVLSKVTAVAGGQSQAIADIVKSVASLSEAAKAAGFTLDQQIASVQVLSQVTNKSADEIATSFKNLFGSISSVGSKKILEQFGISVRDANGDLRDFLDIYHDISDAIQKGVIPAGRVQDVLRGISGGPRRAPDAAALLANLGKIDEVVGKSVGASNEALVANAKVLDTNQAKITQLQNSIDIKVFKQLSQTVADLVDILTKFGNIGANVFGAIPPQIISIVTQLGLMIVLLKAGVGLAKLVGGSIISSFTDATRGVQLFNAELATTAGIESRLAGTPAGAVRGSTAVNGGKLAGLKGLLTGKAGKAAIGVGIAGGAAAGLNAGGISPQDIGSITTALGGIITFIPGLQAVGVAALLAGTGIQFFGSQAKVAEKSAADSAAEIYSLTQSMTEAQTAADGYAKAQDDALVSIKQLQSIQNKTVDDQTALSAALQTYVENTLNLAAANRDAAKSFDELLGKMQAGLPNFKDYAITNPNSPGIQRLLQDLSRQILEASGQSIYNTDTPVNFASGLTRGRSGGSTRPTAAPDANFDLRELQNNPALVDKLVGFYGGLKIKGPEVSSEGIGYIQSALQKIVDEGPEKSGLSAERIQTLVNALQGLTVAVSSFDQNATALAQQQAIVASKVAVGVFTQDQGRNANNADNLIGVLNSAARNPVLSGTGLLDRGGREGGNSGAAEIEKALDLIRQLGEAADKGLKLSNEQLIQTGTSILKLTGNYEKLAVQGDEAVNRGIVQSLKQAGVNTEDLDGLMKILHLDTLAASDAAKALSDAIADAAVNAKATAREQFAQRSLSLLGAENSGQYADNAKGLQTLKDQNVAAYNSTIKLIDSVSQLGEEGFVDLANALSEVNGLQNLYVDASKFAVATDQEKAETVAALSGKLIDAALAAGLNAKQIKTLTDQVLTLGAALDTLPIYKQVLIDVKTHYTNLGVPDQYAEQSAIVAAQEAAAKAQGKAKAELEKVINKLLHSGKGNTLGQLPKNSSSSGKSAASVPSPGLLDIPDEIKNSGSYQSLLQQAIRNARNLQGLVPGETKKNKNDIVELLDGTKRVLETRGIGEEYLRRALDELTGQIKKNNDLLSKADTIRRIRVGAGDFSALANVPVNSKSGVSVGGPNGPVNVTLNINGTVLTPAQFSQFADLIAASIKQQLTN